MRSADDLVLQILQKLHAAVEDVSYRVMSVENATNQPYGSENDTERRLKEAKALIDQLAATRPNPTGGDHA